MVSKASDRRLDIIRQVLVENKREGYSTLKCFEKQVNREKKCDNTFGCHGSKKFWITTIETLSEDDGDNDENSKKAIGLY